jgi:hypothetical protein
MKYIYIQHIHNNKNNLTRGAAKWIASGCQHWNGRFFQRSRQCVSSKEHRYWWTRTWNIQMYVHILYTYIPPQKKTIYIPPMGHRKVKTHMHIHTHTHTHTHKQTNKQIYTVRLKLYISLIGHRKVKTYMHTHKQIHTHTHTCTHTNKYTPCDWSWCIKI